MGLLGKVFGKKQQSVTVEFGKASEFLESEVSEKRKQLIGQAGQKLAEIKHLLNEARGSLKEFEKASAQKRNARVDKIVSTAKENALKQVSSLLDKLEPKSTGSLEEIRDYCSESFSLLRQSSSFGKNVAYAGISSKEEMKQLSESMKQLASAFADLDKILKQGLAVFLAGRAKERLEKISSLKSGLAAFEASAQSLGRDLEQASLEKGSLDSRLSGLKNSPEFTEIDSLNGEKSDLLKQKQAAKTEIIDLFGKVEKPLHRLEKLSKSGKFRLREEQASFLSELIANPFLALKRDPKAELVKAVLLEAKKAIESGAIDLKEKEREKKLSVLQELLSFDFFSESFWKFNSIDAKIIALEKRVSQLPALKREEELSRALKAASENEARLGDELSLKKSQVLASKKELDSLSSELLSLLSQISGKQVFWKEESR